MPDYGNLVVPYLHPLSLTFRQCEPYLFQAGFLEDQVVIVGEPKRTEVFVFYQNPCDFIQTLRAMQIVDGREEKLPDFLSVSENQAILTIDQTDEDDVGEYDIIIYCKLNNYFSYEQSFEITVKVIEPVVVWDKEPSFSTAF